MGLVEYISEHGKVERQALISEFESKHPFLSIVSNIVFLRHSGYISVECDGDKIYYSVV